MVYMHVYVSWYLKEFDHVGPYSGQHTMLLYLEKKSPSQSRTFFMPRTCLKVSNGILLMVNTFTGCAISIIWIGISRRTSEVLSGISRRFEGLQASGIILLYKNIAYGLVCHPIYCEMTSFLPSSGPFILISTLHLSKLYHYILNLVGKPCMHKTVASR